MIRRIIKIDEEKCNGCGICAGACHEGAIEIIEGKAKLMREDYCDGLGDCLSECPAGAISFEEREAPEYNEAAVLASGRKAGSRTDHPDMKVRQTADGGTEVKHLSGAVSSQLNQWPCQIKLAPVKAPYFSGAKLLVAADCTAFAYGSIHQDFMKGQITLIGCPKLDAADYSEKLGEILKNNDIESVTVLRMEVPCCKGLQLAAEKAICSSNKTIPRQVVTISIDGKILEG